MGADVKGAVDVINVLGDAFLGLSPAERQKWRVAIDASRKGLWGLRHLKVLQDLPELLGPVIISYE